MLTKVTVKNFKRFPDQAFELGDSIVLAGPNNAGKSTLLQAIMTWKFALDRWNAQRAGGKAVKRSGVPVPRADLTAVPLREMNLLWEHRRVTGPKGMASRRRLIELVVEGASEGKTWQCGIEISYSNPELAYVRPLGAADLDREEISTFPPKPATDINIVHVPALSGIQRDEPRMERGMQDLLVGQGRPGDILRNLLLEINLSDKNSWAQLCEHVRDLFQIELKDPRYAPAQPYITCEYAEHRSRPLDLSNLGSGTLQVLLIFAFMFARPATIILLDEPDSHQHVILQRQVYDRIQKIARTRDSQIVIATHSEVILDASEPEQVLGFFSDGPNKLTSDVARDQLREAMKRITATELMMAKEVSAVLYVEGTSDQSILREWAQILRHPAAQFFERPFIRPLGGQRLRDARDHLFALQAVVPKIPAVCLLDSDDRGEVPSDIGPQGLTILRWHRYEIENYLLHPATIKRFINFPLQDSQVDDEFDSLIPHGTDLFGDHVALAKIKASDQFLIPLLRRMGVPTPKNRMYLLAATMTIDEIHPEVIEKLDTIAEKFGIDRDQELEIKT